jgi:hypothetical protein
MQTLRGSAPQLSRQKGIGSSAASLAVRKTSSAPCLRLGIGETDFRSATYMKAPSPHNAERLTHKQLINGNFKAANPWTMDFLNLAD